MKNYIYHFGGNTADGSGSQKELLGGKGAGLAEMSKAGLPVPPGFTISTEACVEYRAFKGIKGVKQKKEFIANLVDEQIIPAMQKVSMYFPNNMALFSVRSGARVSMPGMMDTILNVGLDAETLPFWKDKLGERAALDSYRRFLQMFGETALEIPADRFSNEMDKIKSYKYGNAKAPESDAEMNVQHLSKLVEKYRHIFSVEGNLFATQSIRAQLIYSVEAVFKSWDNDRAKHYRKMHGYSDDWGTAVNIQAMVFGNMNDESCSGVLFTRNPNDGTNEIIGEYLVNAQGEDVVAGIRTPESIDFMGDWNANIRSQLYTIASEMEAHYRDMQDMEFTVQDNKLWILQTRSGKRSSKAALKIAFDLVEEGLLAEAEVFERLTYKDYKAANAKQIDPDFDGVSVGMGIPASGSIVSGVAVFSSESAVNCTEPCILISKETTPDDIHGMEAAVGILTQTGGATSHAAVVARGMNKTCVVGCTDLIQNANGWTLNGATFTEGETLTIDGSSGAVYVGEVPTVDGSQNEYVERLNDLAVKHTAAIERYAPEAVTTSLTGELLLETYNLTPAQIEAQLSPQNLIGAKKIYLSVNRVADYQKEASDFPLLALAVKSDKDQVIEILKNLPESVKEMLILVEDVDVEGIKKSVIVNSLEDMLDMTDDTYITKNNIDMTSFVKMLTLLQANNVNVKTIPNASYNHRVVIDMFGGNA